MNQAVLRHVEKLFQPGTLDQKHREVGLFLESGDSMLFDGDVDWRVIIPQEEKVLSGSAESMDHAFGQMHALLEGLLADSDPQTPVCLLMKERRHDAN